MYGRTTNNNCLIGLARSALKPVSAVLVASAGAVKLVVRGWGAKGYASAKPEVSKIRR